MSRIFRRSRSRRAEPLGDVRAGSRPAFRETFRKQLFVRQQNNCARNVKVLRQVSRSWKAVARAERACEDRFPQPLIYLPESRPAILRKWYYDSQEKWIF